MRLWTFHPKYLDRQGLLAVWREGLLAQKVLQKQTKGYKNHSQLIRFKNTKNPIATVAKYLEYIRQEAKKRGYNFDKSKISKVEGFETIIETRGQLDYEWQWFLEKAKARSPEVYNSLESITKPESNPIFDIKKGGVQNWEKKKF